MPLSHGHGKEKKRKHSREPSPVSPEHKPKPEHQDHRHHHSKHDHNSVLKRKREERKETDNTRHKTKRYDEVTVKEEPQESDDQQLMHVKEEPHNDYHHDDDSRHHRHNASRLPQRDRSTWNDADPNLREQRQERFNNDRRRLKHREARQIKQEPGGAEGWGAGNEPGREGAQASGGKKEKEKPTLELSGKLAEDTNTFRGVVIKYSEPEEARKPKKRWRFHPFKGDEALPVLHLHRQSAFLLGRDRRIADIPVDHPSCSKQHAVLQFRLVPFRRQDGNTGRRVSPYVIDLGSANGTYVNNQRIDAQRYVELFEKDVVKFGFSSRDYVLLHDGSDTTEITGDDLGDD